MTQVVAALIRQDDKFMIFQRPESKTRAFQWEFVGGKVEEGESLEVALIRECREEIGVTVKVGKIFCEVDHEYPDITIHLTLFNAEIEEGIPRMLEHNDIRCITPSEIPLYNFCPADDEILKKIIKEF
ncbi:MAG: (deoxy)nucleoside triphosphate pyrophosphohydrolase [Clostridia bacterium]|nr:(deoxy)nucleoside triphosphate pyrophosphohydrolase [Clostridia bacterium]